MELSFKKPALKSCAEFAKNFRYDLHQAFVKDHIDDDSVWEQPPKVVKNYPSISRMIGRIHYISTFARI